ncbi:MAG: hypothetical protein KatS3mg077_1664 [Candidatus Binatia bacterium]|nr:MAG: hypothetical protein KatS3mg077_1664 [Candidatus Binatia bacterium]
MIPEGERQHGLSPSHFVCGGAAGTSRTVPLATLAPGRRYAVPDAVSGGSPNTGALLRHK